MSSFLESIALGSLTLITCVSVLVTLLGVAIGWMWVFWVTYELRAGSRTRTIRVLLASFCSIGSTLLFLAFVGTLSRIVLTSLGFPV